MPRPRSVESLEQLCVQSIAENPGKFKSFSAGRRISSASASEEEELSCFECLPSRFVVSIFDVAKTRVNVDENLLALLVTTRLDTLDLTQRTRTRSLNGSLSFARLNDQTVLHLLRTAALKHSPLTSLVMPSSELPYRYVKDLLPAFPNLVTLDVSYSSDKSVNDKYLALLATHCLNLEELRLTCCYAVTDVGIRKLCGSQDAGTGGGVDRGCLGFQQKLQLWFSKGTAGAGVVRGCKSLVRLYVGGTRVTRRGARLAMEHLPRLQIFDYKGTLQIAAEMQQTDGTRQLNLKNLNGISFWWNGRTTPYVRGSLLMDALRLCPLVVDVRISEITHLKDEHLRSLLNLKCLKKLAIEYCYKISFNGGLLPILKKFGPSSLESLTLTFVREVNIGSIVEYCSNLREILLHAGIQRYSPARPGLRPTSPPHPLPRLHRLTIKGYLLDRSLPGGQPSRSDLSLLLTSAPDLGRIELYSLSHLNDGIMEEAIARHGFPHLKSFQAQDCPRVTRRVVDRLLELDNPLSLIVIEKTQRIGLCWERLPQVCHDPAWKEAILKKNLDLTIRYCTCRDLDLIID